MITRFRVQNFKALHDVTLDLTRIHVLIGPNDSGKSSILEAIGALCRSVDVSLNDAFYGPWIGPRLVWQQTPGLNVSLRATLEDTGAGEPLDYCVEVGFHPTERQAICRKEEVHPPVVDFRAHGIRQNPTWVQTCNRETTDFSDAELAVCRRIQNALSGCMLTRWTGRMLALPAALNPKRRFQLDPSGFGLASCLDDILGDRGGRFENLERRFCKYFPQIRSIKLKQADAFENASDTSAAVPQLNRARGKAVFFEFVEGGDDIAADQVSEGMLLILAFLTILHLPQPPRLLLVEEPENGIHPQRLAIVLNILKEVVAEQNHCQVILTTHSPYVLDHFTPDEVTLCTKDSEGAVRVQRLSNSQRVRDQIDIFTLGEIWTGEGEEALMSAGKHGGANQ